MKKSGQLRLIKANINDDYRNEWKISHNMDDFFHLSKNGELISNTLYRIGGFTVINNYDDYFIYDYSIIIKYVEAHYSPEIMKLSKEFYKTNNSKFDNSTKHLEPNFVIIDQNGVERVQFEKHKSPILYANSCIYSLDGKYYNIETGEFYCDTNKLIESKEFLFLENRYDKDKSKRGVLKIDKKTGKADFFV